MTKEFLDKISKIQRELKAPKSKYNSYGNFYYRSTEDILEAAKPLLAEEGLLLKLTDEMVNIGNRYYVKATAIITDGNEVHETTAYAREQEKKSGMDESQITGSASTYARKYALNGLFNIDDTKDADSEEQANEAKKRAEKEAEKGREAKPEEKPKEKPTADEPVNCVKCGAKLKAEIKTKAGWMKAKDFAAKYEGLCPDCLTAKIIAEKNGDAK